MHAIYGLKPGEVFWAASDIAGGGAFLHRLRAASAWKHNTFVSRGKPVGTPDAGTFWRVIASMMSRCCSPRRRRSAPFARKNPQGSLIADYDLSGFRALLLAGELGGSGTPVQVAERVLQVPVIDHWWQTETGWTIAGTPDGPGSSAGQARVSRGCDAGLRCSGHRRCRPPPGRLRDAGQCRGQAAAAPPGCLPTLLERR